MASPDRHFATAAIFTHSTGLTPNSGDAALYIKSDNKAYIKDSAGTEVAVASIGGTAGSVDNAILRADGTGGSTLQNSDLNIDDATVTTQANVAIVNNHVGQTNSALVLSPKGNGAILANKPNGATSGGNARGTFAVDLQNSRLSANQVASGAGAVIVGGTNNASSANYAAILGGNAGTASGAYSFIGAGNSNQASGIASVIAGGSDSGIGNTSSSTYSGILGGLAGLADRYAQQSHSAGRFAANGDAQRARFVLRCKTTTNAAVEMALDGATTYLGIPSGKVMFMNIKVVGTKSDGTAIATYERQYAVKNVTGTSSEIYAAVVIGTDNAAGTSLAVATVDVGDYVSIKPTGITAETWRWVASVDVVEVAYGT